MKLNKVDNTTTTRVELITIAIIVIIISSVNMKLIFSYFPSQSA